eukprot:gnl/MRDRNA2_/MRDRNA2_62857_c0_seq1.p1 gnl/MRDRNA2_/MRDRNA2_62857_c0~~gnl/MRDRNA2_/MRDRNA2_62857_c0_seq1.p1  ORF type:complete len:265 (+),score=61.72 gnl/MRDRNA2_/MRDRNA2_62857_c0_seq1:131-925(+)
MPPQSPAKGVTHTINEAYEKKRAIAKARAKVPKKKVAKLKECFARWDTDGSGLINIEELFAILRTLNPTFTQEEGEELLKEADQNKDGQIDVNEWIDWCIGGYLDHRHYHVQMEELWKVKMKMAKQEACDEYPEFKEQISTRFDNLKRRQMASDYEQKCWGIFLADNDTDQDGLISYDEVKGMIGATLSALQSHDEDPIKALRDRQSINNSIDDASVKAAFDAHDTVAEGKGKMGKEEFANLMRYLQAIQEHSWIRDLAEARQL